MPLATKFRALLGLFYIVFCHVYADNRIKNIVIAVDQVVSQQYYYVARLNDADARVS